jgi:glycosyltransferase involved in cell wall biosynthesis
MRIAQISTLASPVREHAHGSVESLVWLMTRELTRLGHQVTVFGVTGSEVHGQVVATLPGPYGENDSLDDWHLCEWINLCAAIKQSERFDVLHSHAYLWGLPLESLSRAPMVHTLHITPDQDSARLWSRSSNSCVTALSRHQWSAFPSLRPAAIIPHGVDSAQFTLQLEPQDYVCYLGRFEPGKGPCQAIAAARAAGVRLLMAGPPGPYFRETVQPLIDGKTVEYVGLVQGAERDRLLGGARALVYPIQYPEAFGLVLVEAMLCGTPVAALRLGAVPEIIHDGLTGFFVESLEQLPDAITKCFSLDRRRVRQQAERSFSVERMARDYERIYQQVAGARKNIA